MISNANIIPKEISKKESISIAEANYIIEEIKNELEIKIKEDSPPMNITNNNIEENKGKETNNKEKLKLDAPSISETNNIDDYIKENNEENNKEIYQMNSPPTPFGNYNIVEDNKEQEIIELKKDLETEKDEEESNNSNILSEFLQNLENENDKLEEKEQIPIDKKDEIIQKEEDIILRLEEKDISEKSTLFYGVPDKNIFLNNQYMSPDNTYYLKSDDFEVSNVVEDQNSGYRALSLQIFGTEDNYKEIRNYIYIFLNNNKENISIYNIERYGKIMNAIDYIDIVKNENEPIGDLEFASFAYIFNANIILFELKEDNKFHIISECGRIENKENNKNKLFLNLCLIKGNIFQVIYEKNRTKNLMYNKEDIDKIISKRLLTQDSFELKFEYPKDNRKTK